MRLGKHHATRKSIVVRIAILLAVFFVGDRLLAWSADRVLMSSQSRLSKAYSANLDYEIWIAGNSRAKKSIDSRLMSSESNRPTINLGINGIRPAMLHAMLEDAIELNRKPDVIVIEISYLKNEWDDSQAADFLPFTKHGTATADLLSRRLPKEMNAAKIFHLRGYGGQQFFRSLANLRKDDQQPTGKKPVNNEALTAISEKDIESFAVDPNDLHSLCELISRCNEQNIKVKVILAPYLELYRDKIANLDEWLSQIRTALSKAGVDAEVINDSEVFGDPDLFSDHVHLNREGQRQYTLRVLDLLGN